MHIRSHRARLGSEGCEEVGAATEHNGAGVREQVLGRADVQGR